MREHETLPWAQRGEPSTPGGAGTRAEQQCPRVTRGPGKTHVETAEWHPRPPGGGETWSQRQPAGLGDAVTPDSADQAVVLSEARSRRSRQRKRRQGPCSARCLGLQPALSFSRRSVHSHSSTAGLPAQLGSTRRGSSRCLGPTSSLLHPPGSRNSFFYPIPGERKPVTALFPHFLGQRQFVSVPRKRRHTY